jgi:DNA-binding winged helix-turn-helix (wHTH) protein
VNSYNSVTVQPYKDGPLSTVSSPARNFLHFGLFHLDVGRRELFKDGLRVKVQSKVIEALLVLVEHPGQIITRETLRARLWPHNTEMNYDANVNTTVNKLRHALGDSHDRPIYVETIPRRGYTFIADAQFVERLPVLSSEKSASQERVASPGRLPEGTVFPAAKGFFGALEFSRWFTAGAISLFVGAMLFGAAVVLFVHRGY